MVGYSRSHKSFSVEKLLWVSIFQELNDYGQYSIEFILVVTELIMIQEKTNCPNGTMNVKIFEKFRNKHNDIFSVVSAATFTR